MLTVVAFVLIVGFFGTGPFFVGAQAACSGDNNSSSSRSERTVSRCDVDQVQNTMRRKKLPKELKVEVEGKLYSVPEAVEMITPSGPITREKWWKRVVRKARSLSPGAAADAGNGLGNDIDNNGDGGDEDGNDNESNHNDNADNEDIASNDNISGNEDNDGNDGHNGDDDNNRTSNGSSDDGFDDVVEARQSEQAKNETMSNHSTDLSEAKTEAAVAVEKEVRPAGEHSCQICFDHDHSTVMLPCGHGGLCWDCGLHIYALTEECPMCRNKIEVLVPLNGNKRRCEGGNHFVSSAGYSKDGTPLTASHSRVVQ